MLLLLGDGGGRISDAELLRELDRLPTSSSGGVLETVEPVSLRAGPPVLDSKCPAATSDIPLMPISSVLVSILLGWWSVLLRENGEETKSILQQGELL